LFWSIDFCCIGLYHLKEKKMNRFVKELKAAIATRNKATMLKLSDKIQDAEEDGYVLSDEEEELFERMSTILERM
jgi:hypothetical protein